MSNLTPGELARLRLKAKHGMLTPEEQQAVNRPSRTLATARFCFCLSFNKQD